jgi:serine/threonine protein kinase
MKDVSEKTKSNCCVTNGKQLKENILQPLSPQEPSHFVHDNITGTTYARGRLLGKGGFAKCYELTDVKSGKTYAGKIISKNRLAKPHQKEKIAREVELHRNLKHKHVVGFHSYFEDEDNVYIVLENCSKKSLVHVLKNRKTLTEPEVRYYMKHLIDGCKYTHEQKIIHRDLKLGNMLLNENMHVKIADFGLATKVEYEGEKKMTVCGTPNYIAPEVLQKKGHSYEADIWAMGCIMYALLVGRPPFETSTLKETYMRITANKYYLPTHISLAARNLIQKLLAADPAARPTLEKILQDDFFSSGYCPKLLSTACCDSAPKFPVSNIISRPKSYASPVTPCEAMQKISSSLAQLKTQKPIACPSPTPIPTNNENENIPTSPIEPTSSTKKEVVMDTPTTDATIKRSNSTEIKALPVGSAIRLYQMLRTCLDQMPADSNPTPVQASKPLWVTKWVDYSNKYGFGFQLSDKSVGVLFNDTTRMLLSPDGKTVLYNDLSNKVYSFPVDEVPRQHQKRATLLLYFAQYMDEHLIHGGDMLNHQQNRPEVTSIFMKKWFRTSKAIVMYLNNGTFQVNFFEDHTKVILSPAGQDYQVTYINSQRQAVSYNLLQLRHFGCHFDVSSRLSYARSMLENIINLEGESV